MVMDIRVMLIFWGMRSALGLRQSSCQAGNVLFLNLLVVTQMCLLFNNYQTVLLGFLYPSLYMLYLKNKSIKASMLPGGQRLCYEESSDLFFLSWNSSDDIRYF